MKSTKTVDALVARLRAVTAERNAIARQLADALTSDISDTLLETPVRRRAVVVAHEAADAVEVTPARVGRPLSRRSQEIMTVVRARATAGDQSTTTADLTHILPRLPAAYALRRLWSNGYLTRIAHGQYTLPSAAGAFPAALKAAVKSAAQPKPKGHKPDLYSPSTRAILALTGDITPERAMKVLGMTDTKTARNKLIDLERKSKTLRRVGRGVYQVRAWARQKASPATKPETPG